MNQRIDISRFHQLSLQEIHELLQKGQLTSLELVQNAISHLNQLNPTLNTIIINNTENALNEAKQADSDISEGKIRGLLHGIPITIKDNIEVEGLPTTAGFTPFKHHRSVSDAELIKRLKKAGAIIIGKTNLPALTYDLQTNNQLFGRTNNPWNLYHTPGGSSGGCAVAVSSGISRISFCNDSGGSIRIPSHFCGVYGFKASMGGIDPRGVITQTKKKVGPLTMRTLFSMGMMAQSVSDISSAMRVVGSSKLASSSNKECSPSSIKLLWIDELSGLEVDLEIKNAMTQLKATLTKSGIQIDNFSEQQFDFHKTIRMWGHLSNYETGNELPPLTRSVGNLVMKQKYSKIPMYTDLLKPINAKKYKALRRQHERIKVKFEELLRSYDGLILPAASVLAFPHQLPDRRIGHLGIYTTPLNVNGKSVHYAIATQSYSLPFNVLESPVVSLPIGLSQKRLPIGVQLVGKKFFDFELLEVASVLDQIIPPIGRPDITK